MGATLTVLVKATEAPMIQMALPQLKDRVNAVYGYAAVNHIHRTQTAATGVADGQAEFTPAPKAAPRLDPPTVGRTAGGGGALAGAGGGRGRCRPRPADCA